MSPRTRFRSKTMVSMALVTTVAVVVLVVVAIRWRRTDAARAAHPGFVGAAKCATCHAAEFAGWKTSQHAVAMQDARPRTVLGRFDSTRFSDGGVLSTF